MAKVIIALGSNIEPREVYIEEAIKKITERVGPLTARSALTETEPYGYTNQDRFLNMALEAETDLDPEALLEVLHGIEAELKRVRTIHWGPRTIDLDIILYGDLIMESEDLTIPHADFRNRRFVLEPLAEIDPDRKDPVTGRTMAELLADLDRREKS